MKKLRHAALVLAPLLFGAPATAAPAAPCRSQMHRQFDFWVGEWEVRRPDGKVAGHNKIEKILGGCVLQENWRSANGKSIGHSFNTFADGRWHQTWVDNQGTLLLLDGGLDDRGRMVLAQDTVGRDGEKIRHEIAWSQLDSGEVKQHWRVSKDGGETYKDLFVGLYRRVEIEAGPRSRPASFKPKPK